MSYCFAAIKLTSLVTDSETPSNWLDLPINFFVIIFIARLRVDSIRL